MPKLAILGGKPVRTELFPAYNPIGEEEKQAVMEVFDSGNFSQFVGGWHPDFLGGPKIRAFEEAWTTFFEARHAISVNSNTSGLFAAIGALGIGPGDEVIVPPYTMTATAVAPLVYGAVPIFADIDEETFCIDPKSIAERITPRTKAIMVVHLFGHPAPMDEIMALAAQHNLRVIEDCAQAPGAKYKGRHLGTIGDLGVFSLNYHKHIHTGEGGMVTTNHDDLAERLQLIRNHAEEVVEGKGVTDLTNMIGFNYRMTEIAAAMGIEQLKKLPHLVEERVRNAEYLARELGKLPGLVPAITRPHCTHVYYVQAVKYSQEIMSVHRDKFVAAIKAELPTAKLRETALIIGAGYVRPLYMQPLYQKRASKCAFNCPRYEGEATYAAGLCPTAERMYGAELFKHEYMRPGMSDRDLRDVVMAFEKVYENRGELL